MSKHHYKDFGYPWHERLRDAIHDWWLCKILRKHHRKMDSHGKCYRCDTYLGRH